MSKFVIPSEARDLYYGLKGPSAFGLGMTGVRDKIVIA